jgi:hypothetical protein
MRILTLALIVSASLSGGFLLGSQVRPQEADSMLADAQLVAQDTDVRWVGYRCGDDDATVISRQMPDINECKDIWRLNPEDTFKIPPSHGQSRYDSPVERS